ncbi:unnamed protein product, partial [Amoebophrya sp. A25]
AGHQSSFGYKTRENRSRIGSSSASSSASSGGGRSRSSSKDTTSVDFVANHGRADVVLPTCPMKDGTELALVPVESTSVTTAARNVCA